MKDDRISKSILYEILEQIEHCTTVYDGKKSNNHVCGVKM